MHQTLQQAVQCNDALHESDIMQHAALRAFLSS
jgi:hypothetical protein